jgi:hypothetical protein
VGLSVNGTVDGDGVLRGVGYWLDGHHNIDAEPGTVRIEVWMNGEWVAVEPGRVRVTFNCGGAGGERID